MAQSCSPALAGLEGELKGHGSLPCLAVASLLCRALGQVPTASRPSQRFTLLGFAYCVPSTVWETACHCDLCISGDSVGSVIFIRFIAHSESLT